MGKEEEERNGKKNPRDAFPLGASQITEGPKRVASSVEASAVGRQP